MTCKDCIHWKACQMIIKLCNCKVLEFGEGAEECEQFIPKTDVVKVVRCSECKHLVVHNLPTLYASCIRCHLRFEPFQFDTRTHFCSLGERKDAK